MYLPYSENHVHHQSAYFKVISHFNIKLLISDLIINFLPIVLIIYLRLNFVFLSRRKFQWKRIGQIKLTLCEHTYYINNHIPQNLLALSVVFAGRMHICVHRSDGLLRTHICARSLQKVNYFMKIYRIPIINLLHISNCLNVQFIIS